MSLAGLNHFDTKCNQKWSSSIISLNEVLHISINITDYFNLFSIFLSRMIDIVTTMFS